MNRGSGLQHVIHRKRKVADRRERRSAASDIRTSRATSEGHVVCPLPSRPEHTQSHIFRRFQAFILQHSVSFHSRLSANAGRIILVDMFVHLLVAGTGLVRVRCKARHQSRNATGILRNQPS